MPVGGIKSCIRVRDPLPPLRMPLLIFAVVYKTWGDFPFLFHFLLAFGRNKFRNKLTNYCKVKRHNTALTLKCPSEKSYRLCPRRGTHLPPSKNFFPSRIMHTNCTIARGHKTLRIYKDKKVKCYTVSKWRPFENFCFASLRNTPKFEEPLSQKSFWTKFGSN